MNNVPKPKCSIITFTAGFWSNVSQSKTSHRKVFFDAYIVGVVFNTQWDVQVLLTKKFGRSSVTRHDCLKEPTHLQVHELPPLRLSKMRDKVEERPHDQNKRSFYQKKLTILVSCYCCVMMRQKGKTSRFYLEKVFRKKE